jgi:predicted dehydrogenase
MTRRLRLGMVGGGEGAFIGAVHRMAARLDDQFELVAGALSSDPERARRSAAALHIAPDRAYADFASMASREVARPDGIDAVAIVTPNHVHHAAAAAFLRAGIPVICDKPMTATLEEALDLAALVRQEGSLFALTHNYSGYPMVRQARDMVQAGQLGRIRVVQVEYPQDWLSTAVEDGGNKQASWRTDPARSGPGGALGDIGTHAFHLAEFVSGLQVEAVAADLSSFVAGRRLDDNAGVLLRLSGGARGMLWASQVAAGQANALRLRVYGDEAGLEWEQEQPDLLRFARLGAPPELLRRGGPALGEAATHASRIPGGHPEGYLEAFAQLYRDFAEHCRAKQEGRAPAPASLLLPGVEAGLRGVAFVDAAVRSARHDSAWTILSSEAAGPRRP